MKHWLARKLFALLLAVFIAAGMSLSVAQATSMTAKTVTMYEMDMPDHGDCQDCPDQHTDKGMKACGVVCATTVFAVLPAATLMPAPHKLAFSAARDPLLHGRALPPDPYPPRTSDIG
jgi:hypothetical protein